MWAFPAYVGGGIAQIAGCFAFWAWLRLDRSIWWVVPGLMSLAVFAGLLTLVQSNVAGRAFAAYGGVYITSSLAWLWLVESTRPNRWVLAGGIIFLIGATIIIAALRPSV